MEQDVAAKFEALSALVAAQGEELSELRATVESLQPKKGLLTLSAVARELGVARVTLRRMIEQHRLYTVPGPGRYPRIPRSEVDRLQREGLGRRKRAGRRLRVDGEAALIEAAQRAYDEVQQSMAECQ